MGSENPDFKKGSTELYATVMRATQLNEPEAPKLSRHQVINPERKELTTKPSIHCWLCQAWPPSWICSWCFYWRMS
eukprot:6083754-Amphidinium_carterae.2